MKKVIKVVGILIVVVLVFNIGYFVVNSVCDLFEGYTVGGAMEDSWNTITHMFGLIPQKPLWDLEIPFTNIHVTLGYANAPH